MTFQNVTTSNADVELVLHVLHVGLVGQLLVRLELELLLLDVELVDALRGLLQALFHLAVQVHRLFVQDLGQLGERVLELGVLLLDQILVLLAARRQSAKLVLSLALKALELLRSTFSRWSTPPPDTPP